MRKTLLLLLAIVCTLAATPDRASGQIVNDSLVKYCPAGSMDITAESDTVVVRPERYELLVGQSVYLRAFQCGHMKVREISRLSGVRWWSSDTTIIKVTRTTGRATAVRDGFADIFADITSPIPNTGALRDATRVALKYAVRRT